MFCPADGYRRSGARVMFHRKDIPSILFLALLIFIIVLTLCQILIVHRGNDQVQRRHFIRNTQQNVNRKKMYREMIGHYNFKKYKNIAKVEVFRRRIERIIQNVVNESYVRGGNTSFYVDKVKRNKSDINIKMELMNVTQGNMTTCPLVSPHLVGKIAVHDCYDNCPHEKLSYPDVLPGGFWKPSDCLSRHHVLIVIPFRDRLQHLTVLLRHLIGMLQRQQLEFRIVVVEQFGNGTFNKGRLMNSAFLETRKQFDFKCVIFHDVDLVPENDWNIYSCPWQPTHLSVAVDEMHYRLKYELLVGGVLAMTSEHFLLVNGYSNEYWGWGAEDDDMAYRILLSGLRIMRPSSVVARYRMLRHQKREPSAWSSRTKLLKSVNRRFQMEGLNNVPHNVVFTRYLPLYTHLMVDIGKPN